MGNAFEQCIPGGDVSIQAAADLSAKQYYAVNVSSGLATLASVAGEDTYGLLQNKPAAANRAASIRTVGVSKAVSGGVIAAGGKVTCSSAGKVVAAYGADRVLGIALEAAAVSGDVIPVMLTPMGGFAQHAPMAYTFHVDAAELAAGDLASFVPGFAGRIDKIAATCTTAVTTAAKGADINVEIAAVNTTGGVIDLDGVHAIGAAIEGTAITALNTFTAAQAITVEVADVTTFIEGEFEIIVTLG